MLGPSHTARIFPKRSTTAMAIVLESAVVAAVCTIAITSLCVRNAEPGGGCGNCVPLLPPLPEEPLPPPHPKTIGTTIKQSAAMRNKEGRGRGIQAGALSMATILTTVTLCSKLPVLLREGCAIAALPKGWKQLERPSEL